MQHNEHAEQKTILNLTNESFDEFIQKSLEDPKPKGGVLFSLFGKKAENEDLALLHALKASLNLSNEMTTSELAKDLVLLESLTFKNKPHENFETYLLQNKIDTVEMTIVELNRRLTQLNKLNQESPEQFLEYPLIGVPIAQAKIKQTINSHNEDLLRFLTKVYANLSTCYVRSITGSYGMDAVDEKNYNAKMLEESHFLQKIEKNSHQEKLSDEHNFAKDLIRDSGQITFNHIPFGVARLPNTENEKIDLIKAKLTKFTGEIEGDNIDKTEDPSSIAHALFNFAGQNIFADLTKQFKSDMRVLAFDNEKHKFEPGYHNHRVNLYRDKDGMIKEDITLKVFTLNDLTQFGTTYAMSADGRTLMSYETGSDAFENVMKLAKKEKSGETVNERTPIAILKTTLAFIPDEDSKRYIVKVEKSSILYNTPQLAYNDLTEEMKHIKEKRREEKEIKRELHLQARAERREQEKEKEADLSKEKERGKDREIDIPKGPKSF